ncbi:thiamine pyrophosphate-dependent enzyme [Dethiobacter alkaliphilus]|uniref:Thiamine pyrophosphate protein domain protein TPP-binding n=1 Tax=Dethiobacter alkaliphilus AHT 1 TaxID=555088 RepID=C0GC16_DETAL|nr:thiamine pyrophosphate-dependent enzyme [Dethiobacter alkaliphilus]EEG78751.1 thiamine pyrophosphate protein domain protein TPP-binding [Dethiobacter alkaliphilus AHT 1]
MSLKILKPTAEFAHLLPQEYKDLVENGPFSGDKGVSDLGTFKEIIEEHPHCAGCGVALGVRLVGASLPAPADTLIIGTPGCSFFGLAQTAVNYSNTAFGNQNAVASGLKRMLQIRYPDQHKDVVVLVGDGGIADIGLDMTLHSWLRREKITTIMVDNEVYGNTGGQESGMTKEGEVLNMAPDGKKFPKIPVFDLARSSGCAYGARVTVASPKKIGQVVKKAILVAREVGPSYVQIYTPCPTNLKFSPDQTVKVAKEAEADYYSFEEFISPEAEKFLNSIE